MPYVSSRTANKKKSPKTMSKPLSVAKNLDLARYMGCWYEIACFPSNFQPRDGQGTRATYTLLPDGAVNVLNETFIGGVKRAFIQGTAYKADGDGGNEGNSKLKVKFYVPPFLPVIPVVGDYWVVYVDDGYNYAVVGQPSRKYLWILCRKIHMDEEIYKQLVEKAKEEGYDISKLRKTQQLDPPPEEDEAPEVTKGIWWFKSLFGR